MKDLLVGSTGFVGSNLMRSHEFAAVCHSVDVASYYGSSPELCVYSGVPAAMFLANKDPEADLAVMKNARENLRSISPAKVVLISSIAVYSDSRLKDESCEPSDDGLSAYGRNRLTLEKWVREDFPDALIVRLPALYGFGLKKNFLFDLHTITPAMLKPDLYERLSLLDSAVKNGYELKDNGFYAVSSVADRAALREFFAANDFNALCFTDSRSRFQFYNLSRLWSDITIALESDLRVLNICTPPVTASAVYEFVTGRADWKNELEKPPFDYDMRSAHAGLFGGADGYFMSVNEELSDIRRFMSEWKE